MCRRRAYALFGSKKLNDITEFPGILTLLPGIDSAWGQMFAELEEKDFATYKGLMRGIMAQIQDNADKMIIDAMYSKKENPYIEQSVF